MYYRDNYNFKRTMYVKSIKHKKPKPYVDYVRDDINRKNKLLRTSKSGDEKIYEKGPKMYTPKLTERYYQYAPRRS